MDANFFKGPEMQALRHSLYYQVDSNTPFREMVLEYIDSSSYNTQDAFFYDMIPAIRFLYHDNESIAYTTKNHLVWMNVPKDYKKVEYWDYIYYHECLHQLWETFGVEDDIKKAGIPFDHYILNIASDCVINDFLTNIRKKTTPPNLITPEYIKEKYHVVYNRYSDDQLSLYKKIMDYVNENPSSKPDNNKSSQGDNDGNGENQSGQGDDTGQNSENNQSGQNNNGEDGDGDNNKTGNGGKGNKNNKKGDNGEEENGDSEEGENGDNNNNGKDGKDGKEGNANKNNKNGRQESSGKMTKHADLGQSYDKNYEKVAEDYVKDVFSQYKNSISGDLGSFISKIKSSKKNVPNLKDTKGEGITTHITSGRGNKEWNKKFNQIIEKEVALKVKKASSKRKKTYSRVKRGSGPIEFGKPIQPGKMKVFDGLTITIGIYVDKSGSMCGDPMTNVCNAVNFITDDIRKKYMKNPLIKKGDEGFDFQAWSFDERFHKETLPLRIYASGSNVDLDELLDKMQSETGEYMINIVFTDAGFPVNVQRCNSILRKFKGIVVYVINGNYHESEYYELAKNPNFVYLQADETFTI